jgi:hypothetical protein
MVSVSPEAKLLPEIVRVYVPPSAMHVWHEALDTTGAEVGGGLTVNVVEPLFPLELLTYTDHVPAVPVGGMIS